MSTIRQKIERLDEVSKQLEKELTDEQMKLVLEACNLFADIAEAGL